MPPLTRQEQRDREEFVNRYMREHPDADDVEAEDLWEDRRSGGDADRVDDEPDEPLPQSEAQPVLDEGANEPTAPVAPTSPSAPPTGGPESAPTPAPTQPPADDDDDDPRGAVDDDAPRGCRSGAIGRPSRGSARCSCSSAARRASVRPADIDLAGHGRSAAAAVASGLFESLQGAFNDWGEMQVRDGPMKGTFRLVFDGKFEEALADLPP